MMTAGALGLTTLAYLSLLAAKAPLFGSKAGGWVYPYVGNFSFAALGCGLAAASAIIWLSEYAKKRGETSRLIALALAAFCVHAVLLGLRPFPLEEIVSSPTANSFYGAALNLNLKEILASSQTGFSASFDIRHIHTNMAGKLFFYRLLTRLAAEPLVLGYLIALLSDLGCLAVYYAAKKFFGEGKAAFCSAVVYLFLPNRLYFFPTLNTLTPLFALAPFIAAESFLSSPKIWKAAVFGAAVYLLAFFEPTPLVLLFFLLAALALKYRSARNAGLLLAGGTAAFALVYLAAEFFLGYGLAGDFFRISSNNRHFMAASYLSTRGIWLALNPVEFFLNSGVALSAVFLVLSFSAGFSERAGLLAGCVWISVFALDAAFYVMGCGRAEAARIWIFLGVFMSMAVGDWLAKQESGLAAHAVAASAIVQAAATIAMVGFVVY